MSSWRAQANQSLYLARLLLQGWQQALDSAQVPAHVLAQAYLPAIKAHLKQSYGSFLLHLTQPVDQGAVTPRCVAELAPPPAGRVLPGEVNEFRQLEQGGWLADMLADDTSLSAPRVSSGAGIISSQPSPGSPPETRHWADSLDSLFSRMDDSVDEY